MNLNESFPPETQSKWGALFRNLVVVDVQVASALRTAGQHRKALEQAQRMEQEFVSLMTGQRSVDGSLVTVDSDGGEETEGEESLRVSTLLALLFL